MSLHWVALKAATARVNMYPEKISTDYLQPRLNKMLNVPLEVPRTLAASRLQQMKSHMLANFPAVLPQFGLQ